MWNAERADGGMHTCGFGGVGGCWVIWASKRTRHSNPLSHNAVTCPSGHKAGTQHRVLASPWDSQTEQISAPVLSLKAQREKCRIIVEKLKRQGIPACPGPPNKITVRVEILLFWTDRKLNSSSAREWEAVRKTSLLRYCHMMSSKHKSWTETIIPIALWLTHKLIGHGH